MPRAGSTPQSSTLHKQSLAFGGLVLQQLPLISGERMQYYIRNPKSLRNMLERAFELDMVDTLNQDLIPWQNTYRKLFGKTPDFSTLVVPAKPEGQGPMRLIVVANEIIEWTGNCPIQGTMNAMKKHFLCWWFIDPLDGSISRNDRGPKNCSYALWVRDVREAGDEWADKSADDLRAMGHSGVTLLERILLEANYFFEHSEHMDQQNVTLCSGSRCNGNSVPSVDWGSKGFRITWHDPSDHSSLLSSRSVWV